MLLVVVAVSAAYLAWHLRKGWVPHDEGALAQAAERLLHGELSHRDFDDVYTGGLAYLNAAAFRLFGTTLFAMRIMLFMFFLAWTPVVYYLASRFVAPIAAGGVTLLAVVWSVPNYTAPMPSWYNLFLATFGVAALFRHLETGRARWLVLAGVAGGLSFLVKVIGLYYVAGVLLYFVFRAHASLRDDSDPMPSRGNAYAAFVSGSLLLFVVAVVSLVRHSLNPPEAVQFILPALLISITLAWNEWKAPAGTDGARFRALFRLVGPFAIGIALPVALFLVPYARSGSLGAFVHGVFVLPTKRFGFAMTPAPPLMTMFGLVPLALLALAARARMRAWQVVALALVLALVLGVAGEVGVVYRAVWYSVRNLIPALVVAGVITLARERAPDAGEPLLRSRLMLLLSVTALCSLVQFPFAHPIYFCYVAPLLLLTVVALLQYLRPVSRAVPASLLAFYMAFAVLWVNPTALYRMGWRYLPYMPTAPLHLERGGLVVPDMHAAEYDALVPLLREHAHGEYTWASPDAPEVYFLAGLRNPTRSLFEFFDDPTDHDARLLRSLDQHAVRVIAINHQPEFSRGITDTLYSSLEQRFPYGRMVGRFQVRWR